LSQAEAKRREKSQQREELYSVELLPYQLRKRAGKAYRKDLDVTAKKEGLQLRI